MVCAFNPSTHKIGTQTSVSSKPAWSTQQGQRGLYSETLSRKENEEKEQEGRKKRRKKRRRFKPLAYFTILNTRD